MRWKMVAEMEIGEGRCREKGDETGDGDRGYT
jgi:hypothetical protein